VARAQQTSDARAIIDFSGFITNLAQSVPEVLDVADLDDGARELADALGVPPTMIRDSEQVAKIRAAKRQAAAEEQQREDLVTATDQLAKMSAATPPSST